ncbi:MAG: flippase [Sphingobacteriales bacterium]|jgi:O-antigen/teichoic acid export membrane protein|nr:flippase [Sphingobacteriales bacterium]
MQESITGGNPERIVMRKGGLALFLKAGGMVSQYVFTLAVARLCGPVELGRFTLAYTLLQLLNIVTLLGLDNLLTRKLAAAKAEKDTAAFQAAYRNILRIVIISSILCAGLLYLTAEPISLYLFHDPLLANGLRWMALALPAFSLITLHAAAYRGVRNMTGFSAYRILIPLFNTGLLLIFLQSNPSPDIAQPFTLACMIICLAYLFLWRKQVPKNLHEQSVRSNTRLVLNESLPMMITGSVFFIMNWTDNLLIGLLGTARELAYYDSAFKLASVTALALMAINAIQAPLFAEAYQRKDMPGLADLIYKSTRMLFITTIPASILIVLFAKPLLGLFGPEFVSGELAMKILVAGNVVNALTGSVGILLQMTGHQQEYNRIILWSSLLSVLLCIVLIPKYGIVGAAIASSATRIIQNLFALRRAYLSLGIISIWIPGMPHVKPQQDTKS